MTTNSLILSLRKHTHQLQYRPVSLLCQPLQACHIVLLHALSHTHSFSRSSINPAGSPCLNSGMLSPCHSHSHVPVHSRRFGPCHSHSHVPVHSHRLGPCHSHSHVPVHSRRLGPYHSHWLAPITLVGSAPITPAGSPPSLL